eukprot:8215270-Lingulodinium_polyedra.AAC.1
MGGTDRAAVVAPGGARSIGVAGPPDNADVGIVAPLAAVCEAPSRFVATPSSRGDASRQELEGV